VTGKLLSRFSIGTRQAGAAARTGDRATYFRPQVEGLEDRVTPATVTLPLAVDHLAVSGTQLVGNLLFAGRNTGADVTITNAALQKVQDNPATQAVECSVLHLELAPIHLALLGLHADTSAICLDVTATKGAGVLGDLLCGLSDGLTGTLDLGGIVNNIAGNLDNLLGQLDGLLSGVLGQPLTVDQVFGQAHTGSVCTGECPILDLSLGPVDLSLLGLNVSLDNCADGPVQVCVSATAKEGLLGNLLCGLADGPLGGGGLGGLVGRIDNLIDRLGDLADRLGELPNTGKLVHQVEKLIDKLEKVADRVDSLKDLDHLIKQVEHTVDKLDHLIDHLA